MPVTPRQDSRGLATAPGYRDIKIYKPGSCYAKNRARAWLSANPSEFDQPSEAVPTTRSSFSPKAPAVGEASAPRSLSGHVHEATRAHEAIPKETLSLSRAQE